MNAKQKVVFNPELFPPQNKQPQVNKPPQPQTSLYELQQQTTGLRARFQPNELEYKALTLAYESLRLVWLSISANGTVDQCRQQLPILDGATQAIAEHLLAAAPVVPDEPVPVSVPDWLEAHA